MQTPRAATRRRRPCRQSRRPPPCLAQTPALIRQELQTPQPCEQTRLPECARWRRGPRSGCLPAPARRARTAAHMRHSLRQHAGSAWFTKHATRHWHARVRASWSRSCRMLVRCAVSSATTSSCPWQLAAPASAASTRASASARAICDAPRVQASANVRDHTLLHRTRLPACGVERGARLLVGSEAALDGVEADARALQPLQRRHVRHQRATQRALAGAGQTAQRQQTGRSLLPLRRHALQPGRGCARRRQHLVQVMRTARHRPNAPLWRKERGQVGPPVACWSFERCACLPYEGRHVCRTASHTCARPRALPAARQRVLAGPAA